MLESFALAAHLLAGGLVDEVRLMVNPVLLGAGSPVFGGVPATELTLTATRRFTSGKVLLSYQL